MKRTCIGKTTFKKLGGVIDINIFYYNNTVVVLLFLYFQMFSKFR